MKMHELLDRPEKWTQGFYARDAMGFFTAADAPEAACFCLSGALCRCYGKEGYLDAREKLLEKLGTRSMHDVVRWNDAPQRKWEEVHKLLAEADL